MEGEAEALPHASAVGELAAFIEADGSAPVPLLNAEGVAERQTVEEPLPVAVPCLSLKLLVALALAKGELVPPAAAPRCDKVPQKLRVAPLEPLAVPPVAVTLPLHEGLPEAPPLGLPDGSTLPLGDSLAAAEAVAAADTVCAAEAEKETVPLAVPQPEWDSDTVAEAVRLGGALEDGSRTVGLDVAVAETLTEGDTLGCLDGEALGVIADALALGHGDGVPLLQSLTAGVNVGCEALARAVAETLGLNESVPLGTSEKMAVTLLLAFAVALALSQGRTLALPPPPPRPLRALADGLGDGRGVAV
jgi:hypothetical protein